MIGQKSTELENRDFFDLVYHADQTSLQSVLTSLITPSSSGGSSTSTSTPSSGGGPSGSHAGRSQTTYARVLSVDNGDKTRSGPVIWEIRAHATGLEAGYGGQQGGMRLDGSVITPGSLDEGGLKGKAVWVMGRRIGDGSAEDNGQS